MSFIEQLSAIALLIDFLFGVACGVFGSASLASRREDGNRGEERPASRQRRPGLPGAGDGAVKGFEVVASVIAAFFVIGIGVGVLLVVAMPALRRRRGTRDIGREDDYRPRTASRRPTAMTTARAGKSRRAR